MLKIYMDNCCYNRLYDNQTQVEIHIETQAKLYIQEQIINKKYKLVWSQILEFENSENPFDIRRESILDWKSIASTNVIIDDKIIEKVKELEKMGIKSKDATHIACALSVGTECFITTDKKLLNKTVKGIKIINPIDFIKGES